MDDYDKRRTEAVKAIDKLGRGARSRCAFELRKHPSIISDVLRGNRRSEETLALIGKWLSGT